MGPPLATWRTPTPSSSARVSAGWAGPRGQLHYGDETIELKSWRIESITTSLVDEGSGDSTVLLVHGVPDSCRMWRPVIERLASDYRCVAPDLPGMGRSRAPLDIDLSLPARARWLDQVVERAEIEGPVHLVCHDFGGPTALAWAVTHPEKVASLCIMATCFHREWEWHALGRAYRTPVVGEAMVRMQTDRFLGWRLFKQEMAKGGAGLSDVTTYEEYQLQRYEGGSTYFGPNTLAALIGAVEALATSGGTVMGGPRPVRIPRTEYARTAFLAPFAR